MDVSVVIPTFRRPHALRLTLDALTRIDHPREALEVIVVDDAAEQGTAAVVEPFRDRLAIRLLSQERRGAAAARNAGARAAGGEMLLFLDDDMLVEPSHIAAHLATHAAHPRSMVGSDRWYTPAALALLESTPFGRYRVALERDFRAVAGERRLDGDCVETPLLAANDLSVSRAAFWELGGFDEAYPHAGAEDQDLSFRARHAGMRLVRNTAIRPEHEEDIVTLERFAWREERGGETVAVLAQRFPDAVGRFAENDPISRADGPRLMVKKLAKSALGGRLQLAALHRLAGALERLRAPEAVLHRVYRGVLALHIHRGYRRGLAKRA